MNTSLTTEPTRNTINQRAARARRKDYIQDLERKVRDHERHGIQVTASVQAAARAVADENRTLKEEVRVLRERNAVLEEALRGLRRGAGGEGERQRKRRKVDGRRERGLDLGSSGRRESEETTGDRDENQDGGQSVPTGQSLFSSTLCLDKPPQSQPRTTPILQPSPEDAQHSEHPSNPPFDDDKDDDHVKENNPPSPYHSYPSASASSLSPSVSHPKSPSPSPTHQPNTTPCAQAAIIIANMRGLPSSDITIIETEILPALGCAGRGRSGKSTNFSSVPAATVQDLDRCAVNNAQLFGILVDVDRGTG